MAVAILAAATPSRAAAQPPVPWIDTHTHPQGRPGTGVLICAGGCLGGALEVMDRQGVAIALLMPPPAPVQGLDIEDLVAATATASSERFRWLNGGRSLNPMIHEADAAGGVSPDLMRRFEERAATIAAEGAVGFGEMTALHLSFTAAHPFEQVPPDHPLFLRLADLAAEFDVPIDLHMEAVPRNMPMPPRFRRLSANNPPMLRENMSGFERLLARSMAARIVWAHVGWDNTGGMSVDLLRGLLETYPNLYLQLKVEIVPPSFPQHSPLDGDGILRPEWDDLIRSFPDRFVLGSDTLLAAPEARFELTGGLLAQLPEDLARLVGYENAVRIYRLG